MGEWGDGANASVCVCDLQGQQLRSTSFQSTSFPLTRSNPLSGPSHTATATARSMGSTFLLPSSSNPSSSLPHTSSLSSSPSSRTSPSLEPFHALPISLGAPLSLNTTQAASQLAAIFSSTVPPVGNHSGLPATTTSLSPPPRPPLPPSSVPVHPSQPPTSPTATTSHAPPPPPAASHADSLKPSLPVRMAPRKADKQPRQPVPVPRAPHSASRGDKAVSSVPLRRAFTATFVRSWMSSQSQAGDMVNCMVRTEFILLTASDGWYQDVWFEASETSL